MLRGEEATIQIEWKLEPVLRFCDDADTTVSPATPTTPVSNTQGNGHAPLKPDPSGFMQSTTGGPEGAALDPELPTMLGESS